MITAEADPRAAAEDDQNQTLLRGMFTATHLDEISFPPLVEHVPHLIVEGFGILAGSPKTGKSWLAAGLALACAQGGRALGGIDVQPRHVLLLPLEDGPRRLQTRLRRLNDGRSLPPRLDIITDISPGVVVPTVIEWLEMHRSDATPPLIILDTLGKVRPQRGAGADPYIADYQLGSRIKAVVDAVPGAGLLAVHHTRKMRAEDWLETVSGTQGIAGSADYVLVLTRKRKSNDGTLAVTGRDIAEDEYAIKTNTGIWSLDGMDIHDAAATTTARAAVAQQSRLGTQSTAAIEFVDSRTTTTPAELAAHLEIDGKVASNILARLADNAHIAKRARGIFAPLRDESDEGDEIAAQQALSVSSPRDELNGQRSGRSAASSPLSSDSSSPYSPPGGLTEKTPGMTDRVQQALDFARHSGHAVDAASGLDGSR